MLLAQDVCIANRGHRSRALLITLALAPQRVLDLEQFRSDAREWIWTCDCRWYYDSK